MQSGASERGAAPGAGCPVFWWGHLHSHRCGCRTRKDGHLRLPFAISRCALALSSSRADDHALATGYLPRPLSLLEGALRGSRLSLFNLVVRSRLCLLAYCFEMLCCSGLSPEHASRAWRVMQQMLEKSVDGMKSSKGIMLDGQHPDTGKIL